MTLVPIPTELVSSHVSKTLYLRPETLALLEDASERAGRPLKLTGSRSAWRSYAEQLALWVAYQNGTGNLASHPDTGTRPHMRGAAFDLSSTSASTQAACRAVGLIREPSESWHWNHPDWASMPVIKTLPAGTGSKPFPNRAKDDDMNLRPVVAMRTEGSPEWSLCAPWLAKPGDEKQQGYIVTTDPARGRAWARMYDSGFGHETRVVRDEYVDIQEAARELREQWLAALALAPTGTPAGAVTVQFPDITFAGTARPTESL